MKEKNIFLGRCYQKILKLAMYFLKWPIPNKIEGVNAIEKIPSIIEKEKLSKVLIIISRKVNSLNNFETVYRGLTEKKIDYVIYDQVNGEPSINEVEKIAKLYQNSKCDGLIACGGGSITDIAKLVGARVNNPNTSILKMRGNLKIKCRIPFLLVVPTTAGSGSECTVAAVVTDEEKNDKFAVNDPKLVPNVVVLDPVMIISLPKNLIASTGMDALTHAVECYIGKSNTKNTIKWSKEAIALILENLPKAYNNPQDVTAKAHMQHASYLAGAAFTTGYVGYVHAVAHAIGGKYHISHGVANAIILPYILEMYDDKTKKSLNELVNGEDFIKIVKDLNAKLEIPTNIKEIEIEDLPFLIKHIQNETWPLYPVPNYLTNDRIEEMLLKIKG